MRPFPRPGDAHESGARQESSPMRQLPGRNLLMLQWNAKLVVVVVVLIVLASILGIASCDALNFTW